MNPIRLELTVEETNLILEALGNLPFVKVHELIGKIHQQASSQITNNSVSQTESNLQSLGAPNKQEPES